MNRDPVTANNTEVTLGEKAEQFVSGIQKFTLYKNPQNVIGSVYKTFGRDERNKFMPPQKGPNSDFFNYNVSLKFITIDRENKDPVKMNRIVVARWKPEPNSNLLNIVLNAPGEIRFPKRIEGQNFSDYLSFSFLGSDATNFMYELLANPEFYSSFIAEINKNSDQPVLEEVQYPPLGIITATQPGFDTISPNYEKVQDGIVDSGAQLNGYGIYSNGTEILELSPRNGEPRVVSTVSDFSKDMLEARVGI